MAVFRAPHEGIGINAAENLLYLFRSQGLDHIFRDLGHPQVFEPVLSSVAQPVNPGGECPQSADPVVDRMAGSLPPESIPRLKIEDKFPGPVFFQMLQGSGYALLVKPVSEQAQSLVVPSYRSGGICRPSGCEAENDLSDS